MRKTCPFVLVALSASLTLAQDGLWELPFEFGPSNGPFTRAVNLVHVWNGSTVKFLALSADDDPPFPDSRLWTPPAVGDPPGYPGEFEDDDNDPGYMFCGGHSHLSDGRVLHVGGFYVNDADFFNPWVPVENSWNNPINPSDMTYDRYYPTATTLGDGRVLVCAGRMSDGGPHATIPEHYDPTTNSWTLLPSAERLQQLYPYMFVLPEAG